MVIAMRLYKYTLFLEEMQIKALFFTRKKYFSIIHFIHGEIVISSKTASHSKEQSAFIRNVFTVFDGLHPKRCLSPAFFKIFCITRFLRVESIFFKIFVSLFDIPNV